MAVRAGSSLLPAVVAGHKYNRLVGKLQPVKRGKDFPNGPIELLNVIAIHARLACALPCFSRRVRVVDRGGGVIEKEWPALVLLDERDSLFRLLRFQVMLIAQPRAFRLLALSANRES